MRHELYAFIDRTAPHLAQDALGVLSLCVTFLGVLYLPGLF